MKIIDIKIGEMGEIEIEASGYKDKSCLDALKELEAIFGKSKEVKLKPEGHRVAIKSREKSRT